MLFICVQSGLSNTEKTIIGSVFVAALTALVAIYNRRRDQLTKEADRRRILFADAYKDCIAWSEMLYRIRRRPADGSGDAEIVNKFHDLQESLAFHQGWISAESEALGFAYCTFVERVKVKSRALIQQAWATPGRPPTVAQPDTEEHPSIADDAAEFQNEVRQHLSRWIWDRWQVGTRYRKAQKK